MNRHLQYVNIECGIIVDAIKVLIITGNNIIKVIQINEGIKTLF